MIKSALTFTVQTVLVFLLLKNSSVTIEWGSPDMNAARLICAYLLHMTVMPEVNEALEMIKFTLEQNDREYVNPVLRAY